MLFIFIIIICRKFNSSSLTIHNRQSAVWLLSHPYLSAWHCSSDFKYASVLFIFPNVGKRLIERYARVTVSVIISVVQDQR